jgi:acyl-CoA synthetase (AMP-forming)/AMP-acid ligase II
MINLAELTQRSAQLRPGAPALIDPLLSTTPSFATLERRSELLARTLRDAFDVGVDGRVAILSRNSIEVVEIYLAAARAGILLFPLNWRFSSSQVKEALLDAQVTVVFYEHEFLSTIEELRTEVEISAWVEYASGKDSEYEELIRQAGNRPDSTLGVLPDPASLTHQPYLAVATGGTTGIAKSAVHDQYSYSACTLDYLAAARIAETDVYMMLGQFFHVIGYMTLAYLAVGRPVVIMDFEADECLNAIEQEKVSGFHAIATMLPRLINAQVARQRDVSSLRLVEYGGAPMGEDVIRAAAEVYGAELLQSWGMSEFGPGAYLGPRGHQRALSGERPELLRSCGRAALLSTTAVLDEHGVPVPRDRKTMGEICHRGPNNMISYWNKPEETTALFRDGWIRSGDGATWDEEGYFFIVDRIKSMIVSGGENIFPAEVERTLANHPDIAEVVVVGAPDPEWGEVVKAVVVQAPGATLVEADVARYVEQKLGSYKKPRIVEFLTELPVTPTGKVNRKLLSQPASSRPAAADQEKDE